MNFGLKENTINAIKEVLSKYPQVERAILYGSRAKGNYRNGSDIDLAMEGKKLDLSQMLKIELELDDLLLPYKIDLTLLHRIESRSLLDHIHRVGVNFYTKN